MKEGFHVEGESASRFIEWMKGQMGDVMYAAFGGGEAGQSNRSQLLDRFEARLSQDRKNIELFGIRSEITQSSNGIDASIECTEPQGLVFFDQIVNAIAQQWPKVKEQLVWLGAALETTTDQIDAPFDVLVAAVEKHLPDCGPGLRVISSQGEIGRLDLWAGYYLRRATVPSALIDYELGFKARDIHPRNLAMGSITLRKLGDAKTELELGEVPPFPANPLSLGEEEAEPNVFLEKAEQTAYYRLLNGFHSHVIDDLRDRLRDDGLMDDADVSVQMIQRVSTEQVEPSTLGPSGDGASDRPRDPDYLFRKSGDFWEIAFGGQRFTLKHSKGLSCIAYLLHQPGKWFGVKELEAAVQKAVPDVAANLYDDDIPDSVSNGTDGTPALDAKTKRRLRDELSELDEKIEKATTLEQYETAEMLEDQKVQILAYWNRDTGLGGRSRPLDKEKKKARQRVRKAIKAAIRNIGKHNQELYLHLDSTIKTGNQCSYEPDPKKTIVWEAKP